MIYKKPISISVICSLAFSSIALKGSTTYATANTRHASVVRIRSGDNHGSGVIVKESNGGFLVVTNQHVINNENVHCIESSSGARYEGILLPLAENKIDLALLWFISGENEEQVANLAFAESNLNEPIKFVIATGYPAAKAYTERPGLTMPLLHHPLEGGYKLTYTSNIDKGMSGGGVFDEHDRLIGINAAHQEPLWNVNRKYQSGRPVIANLNRKLDLVALGLEVQLVKSALTISNNTIYEQKRSQGVANICLEDKSM